jgi:hypothetical protein
LLMSRWPCASTSRPVCLLCPKQLHYSKSCNSFKHRAAYLCRTTTCSVDFYASGQEKGVQPGPMGPNYQLYRILKVNFLEFLF